MFTIRDALALDALGRARVVAGERGLDREVRWAQVVDVPDVARWVRGGDLLLTTAVSLRDDPANQRRLVPDLCEKGLAGLVLAVGGYLERVPEAMTVEADRLAFPLIELPWDVPFEDVTLAVSEQIVNAQNRLLRRAAEIHDRFTTRVLQGGGLTDLAADLAAIVACPTLILDASFTVMAAAAAPGVAPVVAPGAGDTLPRPLVAHIRGSKPARGGAPVRAWRVAARPDVGVLAACVVAPIAMEPQTLGYVLARAPGESTGDLDLRAAESAATVAALLLYKERAVRDAEGRVEGSLIDRLVTGTALDEATAAAARYGLDAARRYAVAILSPGKNDVAALVPRLRAALADLRQPRLLGERDGGVALFLSARGGDVKPLAGRLIAALGASHPVRLALGQPAGIHELSSGYRQAREALEMATRLDSADRVTTFDDLGVLHWLWTVPPVERAANAFARKVRLLIDYDRAKGGELLATLEAYVRQDGAITEAAAALGVHRHTLTYRLDKIERLCELDLAAPLVRLNVQVALLDYRLRGPLV